MLQISLEWKFPTPIVPKQQLNYSLIIDLMGMGANNK